MKLSSSLPRRVIVASVVIFLVSYSVVGALNLRRRLGPTGLALGTEMVTYTSSNGRFAFEVSPQWTRVELASGNHGDSDVKSAVLSPFSAVEIQVATTDLGEWELDRVAAWGRSRHSGEPGYSALSTRRHDTPAHYGVLAEYTLPAVGPVTRLIWQSPLNRCYDFYAAGADTAYAFSFCSPARLWPASGPLFLEIIGSIELLA